MLSLVVPRIVSVLADADHTVDGNRIAANGHGLLERVEDRKAVPRGQGQRSVAVAELMDVESGKSQRRAGDPVLPPAFKHLAEKDVGMQPLLVGGDHGGN